MDISSDLASQARLKAKKMQEATKKNANAVVNDVMKQVALKRSVESTPEQVEAQNAAAAAANQINYNNVRRTMIAKIEEHKQKVQLEAQQMAAAAAQKEEVRQVRHEKFLTEEKKRFEQRRAKKNVAISESIKSGIY